MDGSMEIAVLGGFGVGKTMYLERYPEPGETVTGGEYREGPGGKASNQAIQIRRLGVAANLITAIGTDSGAALGRDLWLREGVNTDGVVVLDAPTMVGFICVDSKGDNRIAIAPGALAHMTLADLDGLYPVIDRSAALVVSFELNPLVGFAAIQHARKQGITTLCNPAPATEIPDDVLSCIDYLVPNLSEAAQIVDALGADLREPADIARYLLGRGVGTVIITLGANGVYLDDGQGGAFLPAVLANKVVDTTGAGDSFVGACTSALVKGAQASEAVSYAMRVAAMTVERAEVVPSLPYAESLMEKSGMGND